MRFSLIVMLMLGMTACAKSAPPPKPVEAPIHNASVEDCTHVYERILAISIVENLEPAQLFSKEEVQKAAEAIDKFYTVSGKKQTFFSYCTTQLNVNQTKCMLTAKSFDDMDVCEMQFKTKKSP